MSDKNYGLALYKLIMEGGRLWFSVCRRIWMDKHGGILRLGKLSLA